MPRVASCIPPIAGAAAYCIGSSIAYANEDNTKSSDDSNSDEIKGHSKGPASGCPACESSSDNESASLSSERKSSKYGVCFTSITTQALKKLVPQHHKEHFHAKFMPLDADDANLEAAVGTVCSLEVQNELTDDQAQVVTVECDFLPQELVPSVPHVVISTSTDISEEPQQNLIRASRNASVDDAIVAPPKSDDEEPLCIPGMVCRLDLWNAAVGICHANEKARDEFVPPEPTEDCGFCKFMKNGPCKEHFQLLEECSTLCESCGGQEVAMERCNGIVGFFLQCSEREREYYYPDKESRAKTKNNPKETTKISKGNDTSKPNSKS